MTGNGLGTDSAVVNALERLIGIFKWGFQYYYSGFQAKPGLRVGALVGRLALGIVRVHSVERKPELVLRFRYLECKLT